MWKEKLSSYLASNNNGVENHFVVREVVMAFESAFTVENSHSPVNTIRSSILQQTPKKGKKKFATRKCLNMYLNT